MIHWKQDAFGHAAYFGNPEEGGFFFGRIEERSVPSGRGWHWVQDKCALNAENIRDIAAKLDELNGAAK